MKDQIVSSIVFWFLWMLGISVQLTVVYGILTNSSSLTLSQQLFAITFSALLPLSYGYWSERQDVCS